MYAGLSVHHTNKLSKHDIKKRQLSFSSSYSIKISLRPSSISPCFFVLPSFSSNSFLSLILHTYKNTYCIPCLSYPVTSSNVCGGNSRKDKTRGRAARVQLQMPMKKQRKRQSNRTDKCMPLPFLCLRRGNHSTPGTRTVSI